MRKVVFLILTMVALSLFAMPALVTPPVSLWMTCLPEKEN